MQPTSCVLGIDLGTSAVKLVAVLRGGRIVASEREPYDTISTVPSQAEQDCKHWLNALSAAAKRIRSRLARKARIAGIALTGQIPTLVVLRGEKPVGRAITWQDSRADAWVRARAERGLRLDIYRRTGVLIDGRYLAPMFRYHYGTQKKACRLLSAKDFLFYTFTGLTVTDPSTAAGYGLYNLHLKDWDPELCEFWGITREMLPSIEAPSFFAPLSVKGKQLLGCSVATPVFLGCADSVAGVYAIGGTGRRPQTATVLAGTSIVIMKCDSRPRWDKQGRYLVTPFGVDGCFGSEADLLAGGSAREWLGRVFWFRDDAKTQRALWQSAFRIAPGADGLLFAPFLATGEEGVLRNPHLRGTLTGLTLAHDGAKIARALLEGMHFEIRRCLEALDEERSLSFVRVAGWVADCSQDSQLLADIVGRPVHTFQLNSASAIGATLLTGLIDLKKYLAKTKPLVFRPGKRSKCYNEIYSRYIALFPGVAS
jgi:xylulokinase